MIKIKLENRVPLQFDALLGFSQMLLSQETSRPASWGPSLFGARVSVALAAVIALDPLCAAIKIQIKYCLWNFSGSECHMSLVVRILTLKE